MRPAVSWREIEPGRIRPFALEKGSTRAIAWTPLPGSQTAFAECPIFETLYSGTRGNGKTDSLLMDFARDVGQGYGKAWRGVLFRRTYPELVDVINKAQGLYPRIFGQGARYNKQSHTWKWDTGEELLLRFFDKPDDYWNYHGHAYPWVGWEELTTWAVDAGYKQMFSCVRSDDPQVARIARVRATTNPYGVGHNWVKLRFKLPMAPFPNYIGKVILDSRDDDGNLEPPRLAIQGHISENFVLLNADPDYLQRIAAGARNQAQRKAWISGSWDIIAGGMFDDLWTPEIHVVPFIPYKRIPKRWRITRSYDHGSSKPFSVGWWVESNGEGIEIDGRRIGDIKGDLIRFAEWYGWNGKPNEGLRLTARNIARGIADRESDMELKRKVLAGPADSAIFDDYEPGKSVAGEMLKEGINWQAADKGPGSRVQGWEAIRNALQAALERPQEEPGMYVTGNCAEFLRTFPVLPRDDKNPDDVNTEVEDHIGDETRYRVRRKIRAVKSGNM